MYTRAKTLRSPTHGQPSTAAHPDECCLERPGGADEHRRHHREQEQREQGLPHPQPGGEDAVERTGAGEPGGRGKRRQHEQAGAVERRRRRARPRRGAGAPPGRAARARGRLPCRGRSRRGRAGQAQGVAVAVGRLDRERPLDGEHVQNSTATQNRPGVARVRMPRSGSRANAKRISTSRANGPTWLVATRQRASMRRSLPATRAASRNTDGLPTSRAHGLAPRPPADDRDRATGERHRPVELVGRDHDGGAGRRRPATRSSRRSRPVGVEAGVGLVEQPELGPARRRGRRGQPAGAGRPRAGRQAPSASRPPRPSCSIASSVSALRAPAARDQNRTFSATVRSS